MKSQAGSGNKATRQDLEDIAEQLTGTAANES